jgi:hypothetical protein
MGENFHLEVEAPFSNPCYDKSRWLVMFLRTFRRGRPPTTSKVGVVVVPNLVQRLVQMIMGGLKND